MIRFKNAWFVALAAGLGVMAAQAQPAVSVLTVNLADAYDGYYKTTEANAKLMEAQVKAQEQIEALNQEGNVLVESYQEMVEQSQNSALTEEARRKAGEDSQRKLEEIQAKQAEVTQFGQNTQRALAQRQKTHRDLMFDEITAIVADMAAEKGATMIFDSSGPSVFGAPVLLYSDAGFDITEELLEILNEDAPEDLLADDTAVEGQ